MHPAPDPIFDDLAARYATLVDARGFDDLGQVFTDDAILETGRGRRVGLAEIQTAMQGLHRYERTEHRVLGSASIIDTTGEGATGTVTCEAHHWFVEGGHSRDYQMEITYHDRYIATSTGWRIAHRRLEIHRAETVDSP